MNPDWRRVREIFERALDVAPDRRDGFVREASDDPELRREVRELLESADSSAGALEPPDPEGICEALERRLAIPELRGHTVGSYEIRRVVASGGMGVVFEAEQRNPKRRVALKMVRIGCDPGEGFRRLRHEAELLGRLRHPSIAQVYEAGVHRIETSDGSTRELPWFAMEFVDGARTICEYASEQGLDTERRIELFRSVCDAVHHGHQHGVIHRDLKPENILVDRAGRPKVIDFGVARAADPDRESMTGAGQILGTLRYMSPEQVAGRRDDVGACSDVYSLGVVLFELLASRSPYDLDDLSVHDVARTIGESSPHRLRDFDRSLAGDLDVIAGKALAKEPERRYRSAAELGDDLGRYLDGQPIVARMPSVGYQLRMFARRHRVMVGAALLVVVASVAAAVLSFDAARAARRAQADASREHEQAARLFAQLLDLSLTSVLDFQERMEALEGSTELRRDMVRKALSNLEALAEQAENDHRILVPLSRAYTRLARLQGDTSRLNLGDRAAARDNFAHALGLAEQAAAAQPDDDDARLAIAEAEVGLGSGAADENFVDESAARYRRAISLYEGVRRGDPLAHDFALAAAWSGLGTLLFHQSRRAEALEAFESGEDVTRRARDAAPEDPRRIGNQCASLAKIGAILTEEDRPEEALSYLRRAAATQELLLEMNSGDFRHRYSLAKVQVLLAELHLRTSRFGEAEDAARRSVDIFGDLARRHAETVNYALNDAYARQLLGRVLAGRAAASESPAVELWSAARDLLRRSSADVRSMIAAGRVGEAYHEPWFAITRRALEACDRALQAR